MNNEINLIGIAYNAYDPAVNRGTERLSEESIKEVAEEAYAALTALGYSVVILPLRESLLSFLRKLRELKVDVLINLCEGFLGRPQLESNIAAVFEAIGIPFTGNASRALGLCQDKFKSKAILNAFGLPTAKGRLVTSPDQTVEVPFPVIIKPNFEDASLGIYPDSVVFDQQTLMAKIQKVIDTYKQPALIEEFIEGREFNVAILEGEKLEALPVSEIDFSSMPESSPHIISYEAKWFEDHELFQRTPPICPAPVDEPLRDKLHQNALAAFQAMGCRDYARVDFRMGKDGRIVILEVNPNPDISLNAGYARALRATGMEYGDFWHQMIDNASKRKEEPWYSSDDVRVEYPFFWYHLLENALRRKGKRWFVQ